VAMRNRVSLSSKLCVIRTNKIYILKEELRKISELIETEITPCTLQLFQLIDSEFISQGSAVLIEIEGENWLLTASHVSNCHKDGKELFFQYITNEFLSIAGIFGETPISDKSQIDFAIIKLEPKCVDKLKNIKRFLNPTKTCLLQDQFQKQMMVICGLPSEATDTTTPQIISVGNYYLTNTSNQKPYNYYNFNPDNFIIVDYAGKGFDLKTDNKKSTHEPYGMSGGGLWKIWQNNPGEDYQYCLAGILTEKRKGKYHVIIANKINLPLDKIYESITTHNKRP